GIIQISEIEELLNRYNIGKKPLAKLLGWGEVTIIRYLKGLTPSKEYSEKLKELQDPYKMQEILNQNGHTLQKVARKKVEDRIKEMLHLSHSTKQGQPINSIDVATYFLNKVDIEAGDLISHLKLQKLVYYAQAWMMAFLNKIIIKEDFQAWVHGPVIPEMYNNYKKFGANPIPKVNILDENIFNEDEKLILNGIWNVYGKYNAKYLEALTHMEDPWRDARGNCQEDERCTNVIEKENIKTYYSSIKDQFTIKDMDELNTYVSSIKIKMN
ncbi:Panacea domain-containing protein, partial [Inediibacterium massiliense]|uniref:Panacea domain-containing protein n=1 Tax=Inediibacterium massiliense TaxID=1658111 RepID=UPI0006B4D189